MRHPVNNTPLTADQQKLAADNIGLAYKFASKNPIRGEDHDDTVSICMMGLIRAARKYNPARGVRFSTYAYACMKSAVVQHGRSLQTDRRIVTTLTQPFSSFGRSRCYDVADPDHDGADERSEMKDLLATALDQMEPRMAAIIRLRFFRGLTLKEVGGIYGVTRERVRQIETKALWMLRRILDPGGSEALSPEQIRGLRRRKKKGTNQYLAMAV